MEYPFKLETFNEALSNLRCTSLPQPTVIVLVLGSGASILGAIAMGSSAAPVAAPVADVPVGVVDIEEGSVAPVADEATAASPPVAVDI